MKSKPNPFHCITACSLLTVTAAFAVDYNFGPPSQPFTITATDQGRERLDWYPGTFQADTTPAVYDRDGGGTINGNALNDITYIHFDLSSLEGKTIVGDVSLNYVVNATWGGAINSGVLATANNPWTYSAGGTTPGYTAIGDSPLLNGNFNTNDVATWTITNATFTGFLGNLANFNGLAITAGDGATAHFAGLPTLTGTVQEYPIRITGATDWSVATFDEPNVTLTVAGTGNVSGGDVALGSTATLRVLDSATLSSGNFSGSFDNNGTLDFAGSANQTLSGSISGTGSLLQNGTGTLVITGNNSYSGATVVNDGVLQVADGGNLGSGTIANNASLVFNRSDDIALTTPIGGTGSLTKSGAGTLTLTVGNSYTGQTIVDGGTLALAAANSAISTSSSLTINNGGTVSLEHFNPMGAPVVTTVTINSGGLMTMNNNWSVNLGPLTLAGGELSSNGFSDATYGSYYMSNDVVVEPGTSTISAVKITASGARTFDVASGGTLNVTGSFSSLYGSFGLIKAGAGTMVLSGSNDYDGNTTVDGGTLEITSTGSLRCKLAGTGNNVISGTASLVFNGTLNLDLAAADLTPGNDWTIIDVSAFSAPPSFGPTFAITSNAGAFAETSADSGIWKLTEGTNTWTFTESDGMLVLTAAVAGNTYADWAATNAPGQTPAQDYDNDGVENGVEYFMGVTTPGFTANPAIVGGTISWPKSANFEGSYVIQTSPDLGTWTNVPSGSLDLTDPAFVKYSPTPGLGKVFVRIAVTPN